MIDKETLMKFSKLNNLRPWQQEKHYIQSLILVALSEYPLVFKGGTYLWFFHGLDRFSEDLDFTANGRLPENLDEEVSGTLRLFGIENTVKRIGGGRASSSFRIGANGPLHTSEKDICYVYVEISRREKISKKPLAFETNFPAYRLPVKVIMGMSLDEVAAEKVRAIMMRDNARDLYDLAFLLKEKKAKPRLQLVNEKLKYYESDFSKGSFTKKVRGKRIGWTSELKQLVFGKLGGFDSAAKAAGKWASTVVKNVKKRNRHDKFPHKVQREKMKELWDNKDDDVWKDS